MMNSVLRRRLFLSCAVTGFLFALVPFISAMRAGAAAATPVFTADRGKLVIQLDGQTVGNEQFEIAPVGGGWVAKGTTDVTVPGETAVTRVSGTLTRPGTRSLQGVPEGQRSNRGRNRSQDPHQG